MRDDLVRELRGLLERSSDDELIAAMTGTTRWARCACKVRTLAGGTKRRLMMHLSNEVGVGEGEGQMAEGQRARGGGGLGGRTRRGRGARGDEGRHGL